MKNLIISSLLTTIMAIVAPFTDATVPQCIVWFIATTVLITIFIQELERIFKQIKKRVVGATLKGLSHR